MRRHSFAFERRRLVLVGIVDIELRVHSWKFERIEGETDSVTSPSNATCMEAVDDRILHSALWSTSITNDHPKELLYDHMRIPWR